MPTIAILDVDGTLVDTNYHHAIAWFRAFRRHDLTLQVWRIHRHIGMGGDQLVAAVAGDEVEEKLGDDIREAESEEYKKLIDEVQTMEGSRELIGDLQRDGRRGGAGQLGEGVGGRALHRAARCRGDRRRVDDLRRCRADQARARPRARGARARSTAGRRMR